MSFRCELTGKKRTKREALRDSVMSPIRVPIRIAAPPPSAPLGVSATPPVPANVVEIPATPRAARVRRGVRIGATCFCVRPTRSAFRLAAEVPAMSGAAWACAGPDVPSNAILSFVRRTSARRLVAIRTVWPFAAGVNATRDVRIAVTRFSVRPTRFAWPPAEAVHATSGAAPASPDVFRSVIPSSALRILSYAS